MPRQYQPAVKFSDSNRYDPSVASSRFVRALHLVAILAGYASLNHAVFLA